MNVTELEERLATQDGPEYKRKMLVEVSAIQARLSALMRTPLLPQEYASVKALSEAAISAHEALSARAAG